MSRDSAEAECIICRKTFKWFFEEPRACPSCKRGTIGLCGGSWICKECKLIFIWNNLTTQAVYRIGPGPIKEKQVGGKTRPERCPECGHKEIDSSSV